MQSLLLGQSQHTKSNDFVSSVNVCCTANVPLINEINGHEVCAAVTLWSVDTSRTRRPCLSEIRFVQLQFCKMGVRPPNQPASSRQLCSCARALRITVDHSNRSSADFPAKSFSFGIPHLIVTEPTALSIAVEPSTAAACLPTALSTEIGVRIQDTEKSRRRLMTFFLFPGDRNLVFAACRGPRRLRRPFETETAAASQIVLEPTARRSAALGSSRLPLRLRAMSLNPISTGKLNYTVPSIAYPQA